VFDLSPPIHDQGGALILPVLTVLYRSISFDLCGRRLTAKQPIDAESSQNYFSKVGS